MEIEFKNVSVAGIKDDGDGIVETIVSVTGIVDNVRDIIKPGAYEKTLAARKPKGVWHHSWTDPVSKTLDIKELMPGDPMLPKELPNGQPWPKEAGALWVKTQFNLDGPRGVQAYSDVKFFGDEQEWSIGYNVPTGGSKVDVKSGIRNIETLDLYEYSPVLFGAMPSARTQGGVKEAQMAFKTLGGSQLREEVSDEELVGDFDSAVGELDPEDFDLPETASEKSWGRLLDANNRLDPFKIRTAIKALQEVLDDIEDEIESEDDDPEEKEIPLSFIEMKAAEYSNLRYCLEDWHIDNPLLVKAVADFDSALQGDGDVEEAAEEVVNVLEDISADDETGEKADEVAMISATLGTLIAGEKKSLRATRMEYLEQMSTDQVRELKSFLGSINGSTGIKNALQNHLDELELFEEGGASNRQTKMAKKPKPKPHGRKPSTTKPVEMEDEEMEDEDEEKSISIPLTEFTDLGIDIKSLLGS